MNNPYRNIEARVSKLLNQYKTHGRLIIGVDFDFTIYDPINNVVYDDIVDLLKKVQTKGHILCSWSANLDESLVRKIWQDNGLTIDYYNESPAFKGNRKPHFNILLDDIVGLNEAILILEKFI